MGSNNYNQLAAMMGTYPQLAIFRRFLRPNARNLLIMQAQIANLSSELGDVVSTDFNHADRHNLEKCVYELEHYKEGSVAAEQWTMIKQIRVLLKEYSTTAIWAISRLPAANRNNSTALRDWLVNPEGGQSFLSAEEAVVWDAQHDLTSVVDPEEPKDVISRWIDGPFMSWFYREIGRRYKSHTLPLYETLVPGAPREVHLDYLPDSNDAVTVVSTVFASTLPTLSIFGLYYINVPLVRLGLITVFTSLFRLIIALLTNAKRSDFFTATSAFAAVLVVFVGNTDGCNQVATPA